MYLDGDHVLYAHWTAQAVTHTVTFNPNGGTVSVSTRKVTNGQTYGELPVPEREGYIFAGWYTKAEGGGKVNASDTVNLSADQTLYAHWVENELVASGTCGENLTWTLDEAGVLTISGTGEMTNYAYSSYAPWVKHNSSIETIVIENGVTTITDSDTVNLTGDQTLYAHWKKVPLATSGKCGANLTWTYDQTGTLTISGRGAMTDYASFSDTPWFELSREKSIRSVTMGDGVTSVGTCAFSNFSQMENVTVPVSVTEIGDGAFSGCSRLQNVYYTGSLMEWGDISFGKGNDPLINATFYCNSKAEGEAISVFSKSVKSLTLMVFENTRGCRQQNDYYRFSSGTAANGYAAVQDRGNGSYRIDDFSKLGSLTISKPGYASVTRTKEQLAGYPQIYLEPVEEGFPTITAVWLDGIDIRHFEGGKNLLGEKAVTLKADVTWPAGKGQGKLQLVQGSKRINFSGSYANGKWSAKSFEKSVQKLKGAKNPASSSELKSLAEDVAEGRGSFGIDAAYSVIGYAEGYLDKNGYPHWQDTGVIIDVSGSADYSLPFLLGPVPVFFEAKLSAEVIAQLNLLFNSTAKSFTPNGSIQGDISLSGGLGIGVRKLLSVSGGVEGTLNALLEIPAERQNHFKLIASLSAYAKAKVLFWSYRRSWPLVKQVWCDEYFGSGAARLFSEEASGDFYSPDDFYNPARYTLASEAEMTDNSVFLANSTASLFSAESGGTGDPPFVSDVYNQPKPQLAAFSDGTLLAVWTGLDNSRATYDRPRLYYSFCTDGTWSDPAPVNTSGKYMEADPALTIVNDVAYLAWCGADSAMGTPASMEEMASKLDIFAASFDLIGGQWAVSALTEDQSADYSPVIGSGPGGVSVAWQSNSASDLFGSSGTNSVSGCQYADGEWIHSIRYDGVGEVIDLSIDMSESIPRIAWSQAQTDGACAVYLDDVRYASGSGVLFDNGRLYWYQDGHLYQDGQDTGAALDTDHLQIENGTLLYLSSNGLYSALMAQYYDNSTGLWSGAVALMDGVQSLDSFSAASIGTSLQILMDSTEVSKELDDIQSDKDDPYGNTNLVLLESTPFCDLSIGEPWYMEDTYTIGSAMTFHLDVTNNGTIPANYMVSVSSIDGTAYDTISRQRLLPGCTEEIEIACTQGEVLDNQLTFIVKALDGGEDENPSDNQTSVTLQYEDVSVEHIGNGVTEDGQYLVYADIVNRGYGIQSDIAVSLYLDAVSDTPLKTVTVGPLASMASQPVSFQVPAPADQACYVIAATSNGMDMNAATDSDFTVCISQEDTPIELVSVDGNQVRLSLENVPAGTLVVAAYDGNGKMDSVGMSAVLVGDTSVQVTMRNTVPEGDSLVAFVLDTVTQEPLMKRVDLA